MSETVHGTAVLVGASGLLVRGPSGAGKSTLAAGLIAKGARLIADDRVHLSACAGRLVAAGVGALAGRLELRGLGIVTVEYERSAVIRLVADLVEEELLERLPEPHELRVEILGVRLPRQPIPAASGRATILIEAALKALTVQRNMDLRSARVWG